MRRKVLTILIIGLIFSIIGTTIFLAIRYRPIHIIEIYEDKDFRKYHLPGKGTVDDPYIIEGFEFSGNDHHCILINGVTKHFIIRNCILRNTYAGIMLGQRERGTFVIENNTISDISYGMEIFGYEDSIIRNNRIERFTEKAIDIALGKNYSILSNAISNNFQNFYRDDGIQLGRVNEALITNNTFDNCDWAIEIDRSEKIAVFMNNFTACDYGLFADNAEEILFENNTIGNCDSGVVIQHSQDLIIRRNAIRNSTYNAIALYSSDNCLVELNNCSNNDNFGLKLNYILSSQCQNNIFENNLYGIQIFAGKNLLLNNNTCYNNTNGIILYIANETILKWNNIEHNLEYGLISYGTNATIWNNNFIENNYTNISTIHSQAKAEEISNNFGIDFIGVTIFYNNDTQVGNYWSDLTWYLGVEYTIDPGNHTDKYPLEYPVE